MRKIMITMGLALSVLAGQAHAVPSFARQTGMACEACHTSYPELNQFGRFFKMNGYTATGITQVESAGNDKTPGLTIDQIPPLSLMLQTSQEWKKAGQYDTNTNDGTRTAHTASNFPLQLSVFFAGEISKNMGSMVQITYAQNSTSGFSMDNSDIRYVDHTSISDKDVLYGLTLNNNPSVEDPWQTTPTWGYPFLQPSILKTPSAKPLIANLAQQVYGIGGYTLIDQNWYLALTGYRSAQPGVSQPYSSTSVNIINGIAPYWRLAHQSVMEDSSYLEVGTFGMDAHVSPSGVLGPTAHFFDTAVDLQYEKAFESGNSLTIRSSYIHETQDYSGLPGYSSNPNDKLNTFNINGSYHVGGKETLLLGYLRTGGTADINLYNPGCSSNCAPSATLIGTPVPVTGNVAGKPTTTSWLAQLEVMPWQNVQIGLQYTGYLRFNGQKHNYDGAGTNAKDNDVAMLYGWFMW